MTQRGGIERLSEQLSELFEDLWRGPRLAAHTSGFRPRVDIYVTTEPRELTIVAELAGLEPDDLQLALAGDILVVSGSRDHVDASERGPVSWYQAEIARGPFEWRVRLPANADPEAARATYDRGLLTIVLPLSAEAPSRVPVTIRITTVR